MIISHARDKSLVGVILAVAVALAAVGVPLAASPAAAAVTGTSCSAKGAFGQGTWTWNGKNSIRGLNLTVTDTAADGHRVAIRLVTAGSDLDAHHWSWHHLYAGKGSSDTWSTTAEDSRGLKRVSIEAAVFEGNDHKAGSLLNPAFQFVVEN
ncbi:hypothetical protein [Streptomyces sp. NPDC001876]|uniref:hypothetical protein n=1 Tax=Streptomyces sp. NPDC001876 TaxID=3154402 RepID=UPI00331A929A